MTTETIKDRYRPTLGNPEWLSAHEDRIKALLPSIWTHIENLAGAPVLRLGFQLKLWGVPWRSTEEFGVVMEFFEWVGFLQRQNGYQVRANPSRVMPI